MTELDPLDGIEVEELLILEASNLSARHREFVIRYLRHRNAAKAAQECGYAKPFNRSAGDVMQARGVREMIATLTATRLRRLQVTPTRIEQELAKVAFASIGDIITVQDDGTAYIDFTAGTPELMAALRGFSCEVVHQPCGDRDAPRQVLKMKVELSDKLSALGKLAQIHKMVAGSISVDVSIDIADAIREARARAGLSRRVEGE